VSDTVLEAPPETTGVPEDSQVTAPAADGRTRARRLTLALLVAGGTAAVFGLLLTFLPAASAAGGCGGG
jgi:hypothetical protein